MCFCSVLEGLFDIGEGTKTWGHGREQAIFSGQFIGYMCWFFSHLVADYGRTFGINKRQDRHFAIKLYTELQLCWISLLIQCSEKVVG